MKKGFLLISGLLVTSVAYSSVPVEPVEPLGIDSLINLQGVVVSANKIQVNRNSVPLSISVIDREEIEASSESALLPVLSQRVPGLFVTQKGITGFGVNDGSAGTVNIRGVGQGNKVLMLFDGQPQWAGIFGHALPDTYVASDVERVEVIRGPGSLMYGSNAMGGVVNIITRHHKQEGRRTQARIMYGSYNTQKYMVNNGYNIGNFSSFISLNHDRTDGHRPNSKFHITNGFANLGYKINEHYRVTGDLSLAKFKTQNPGEIDAPVLDYLVDVLRGTTSFALENHHEKTSGALRVFYNWGNHEVNDGYKPGGTPRTYLFRSDDHNTGVLLYQSFRLVEGNTFTAGIDYKNWGGHAWNDSINGKKGELIDKSVNEVAGYVIMQQDLFDMLSINAGVRYEHNSVFGGEWVPQAGLTVRPFEGNVIRASFSKGFRSPNIREMYMWGAANDELKPENMLNYEVAVGQSFLDGRLYGEVTAFFIDGKNMIESVSVVPGQTYPMKNRNVGTFTNKGIELEGRYQILRNLSMDMNYSYLHTSKALLAAPAHKLNVGATYSPGRFTFNANVQSVYDLYVRLENPANKISEVKENYTVLNARAAYRFGSRDKGLNLFVKGENLTATRYTINYGFPMPKAVFMGGIDVTF
ncbi:TonB-dependent receptor [Parabacteroides gordonii]|mgnify:FL=1|jgi:outer membrane receptor protein involved in Fe transport|uniref:TonB-dependent receptor plug domain-containing protein n=1 Tax=Parabacteroides gordonii TaxID=574930 RepID=UPI00241FE76A|nr:TonB-dependent receptor [Parabacteroides gordonii]